MTNKKRPHRKRKLTLKDVGIVDDGTFKLCPNYMHTKSNFKVIHSEIIGYALWGDGQITSARVVPIFGATIYLRDGRRLHAIRTMSNGDPFNDGFDTDPVGASLASAMHVALIGLHAHKRVLADHKKSSAITCAATSAADRSSRPR